MKAALLTFFLLLQSFSFATPLIIAHKGGREVGVGNSLAAFQDALDSHFDVIELDLQLTRDKVPVIEHDSLLETGNFEKAQVAISELKLEEIQNRFSSIRLVRKTIPSFQELLKLDNPKSSLMVELKSSKAHKELIDEALKMLKNYRGKSFIGSLSPEIVLELLKRSQKDRVIGIASSWKSLIVYLKQPIKTLALDYSLIKPALVKALHKQDKQVWAWTVNDIKLAKELSEMGVDGIITDYPHSMRKALN